MNEVDPVSAEKVELIRTELIRDLQNKARAYFPVMLAELLGAGSMIILNGMGVDWKQVLKETINEELDTTLHEMEQNIQIPGGPPHDPRTRRS